MSGFLSSAARIPRWSSWKCSARGKKEWLPAILYMVTGPGPGNNLKVPAIELKRRFSKGAKRDIYQFRHLIICRVLVSEFDFHLPEELIAQEALADRADSRLLHLAREVGDIVDRRFRDF